MKSNENIICISSIDWDFIWQGHQEIMSTLAKNGNRVLFIENTGVRMPGIRDLSRIKKRIKNFFLGVNGIREESDNLFIFSPLVLPFPYLKIAKWINHHIVLSVIEKWVKIMSFHNTVSWVFLPTPLSLDILDNLGSKLVIYYCIDNFRVSSVAASKIKKSEITLLKTADMVFVTSKELYDYCSIYNHKVSFFPFAVNFRKFENARLGENVIPSKLSDIKKPIVGYIGGIHKWIDLNLVKEIALKNPEYSLVMVGPLQADVSFLKEFKNIHFLGKIEHNQIPYFIRNFDACIIPYLVTDYTRNVYPTKLNEYLAMGKPVISTDIPEVANFNRENDNLIYIGKNYAEFSRLISEAVNNSNDTLVERRIRAAKKNSWEVRIEEMSNLIEETIIVNSRILIDWKKKIRRLYAIARRKILGFTVAGLAFYFLIFHTPLLWYLASPLKISQPPQKADCIVVFAGGVGESGRAGQGYEERVDYAVKLYKQGYAAHLIFSSGTQFVFNEAEVMKSLAVSLGVPADAIILEEKAANTYQNVKFTKEILDKRNWKKVLLISSPYHMGRVSLVVKKVAPQTAFIYTPSESRFYSHDAAPEKIIARRINLKQIKSILHEYTGILYYRWKGYIQ